MEVIHSVSNELTFMCSIIKSSGSCNIVALNYSCFQDCHSVVIVIQHSFHCVLHCNIQDVAHYIWYDIKLNCCCLPHYCATSHYVT